MGATVDLTFTTPLVGSATVKKGGGPIGDTYSAGDTLTIVGGGANSIAGQLSVSGTDLEQKVTSVNIADPGYYPNYPPDPANPVNTVDVNGTGSGATFNLTINPLAYAPTGGVTSTIPGSSTPPANGGLIGTQ